MAVYTCTVCDTVYDEAVETILWNDLPPDWICPVCDSGKSFWRRASGRPDPEGMSGVESGRETTLASEPDKTDDRDETCMVDINTMAETGQSIIEPMRTRKRVISWDDLLFKGAQLARIPLNHDVPVLTRTVIGPAARQPLEIDIPIFIAHMSFGALSREAKIALARGSAAVKTAMCSGEGGILPESRQDAHRYIFEYVPNRYSVNEENLRRADAIELKIGQSAKPGLGGHLPAEKVTREIAGIRGVAAGRDIISPARYEDICTPEQLREKVAWLRDVSGGRPIGIKFAAGHVEADLEVALFAEPDFITLDGRAGGTGAAPKYIKASVSVPTLFALHRARKFLDARGAHHVSLVCTGGLRVAPDFAKALALGADAVAIGTTALIAIGCKQYRVCNTGKCPTGIATQDPELRSRLDIDHAARRLENFLRVSVRELADFARLTGNDDVHGLSVYDLCTTRSEISAHTDIEHV